MLERIDQKIIPKIAGELRLFSVVRNERDRLDYFIRYYSALGVQRFFFVDNGSTDGTLDVLANFPNVHVFRADGSFAEALCGSVWLQQLAADYAQEGWMVVADADEFLVVPGQEHTSLQEFCKRLSSEGAEAFRSILVDMYSDKPIIETTYLPGSDPLEVCPYFESKTIYCVEPIKEEGRGRWSHFGGVRFRLFNLPVLLDKVALIKYRRGMEFELGQHGLRNVRFSSMRGATLHFKFFNTFYDRAIIEAARGEHWRQAQEYRRYATVLADRSLTAFGILSQVFRHSNDLLECGVMRMSECNPC